MQKRKFEKIKFRIWQAVLVALILFVLYLITGQLVKTSELKSELSTLDERLQTIEQENIQLEKEIQTFSDPDVIDREARERLNLKKEGENVVIILPEPASEETQPASQEQESSFWQRIKNLFSF